MRMDQCLLLSNFFWTASLTYLVTDRTESIDAIASKNDNEPMTMIMIIV